MSRCSAIALISFFFLFLVGCRVLILSGPSRVAVGEPAVYVLDIGSNQGGGSPILPSLDVQVPTGWILSSATYEGVLVGEEISGLLQEGGETNCTGSLGSLPEDFQRFSLFVEGISGTEPADFGSVTLEFQIMDQPVGTFEVGFVFGGQGVLEECSVVTRKTINREGNPFLTLGRVLRERLDDPDGLGSLATIFSSPGDSNLYAFHGHRGGDVPRALKMYRREEVTGELDLLETIFDGPDSPVGLIIEGYFSSDGKHLYGIENKLVSFALSIFERSEATGSLTFLESLDIEPRQGFREQLAISPDGQFLYVVNTSPVNGITIFSRDPDTGSLTSVNFFELPSAPSAIRLDPSGIFLYTALSDLDTLMVLARDATTGSLSLVQEVVNGSSSVEGLRMPSNLAVSPDGAHLYAGASFPDDRSSLVNFQRDFATGELTFQEVIETNSQISSSRKQVTPSADGKHLIVIQDSTVSSFQRTLSGDLIFEESHADGFSGLEDVVVSADNRHLFLTSPLDRALLSYRVVRPVFADGFESGDTLAWTVTSP